MDDIENSNACCPLSCAHDQSQKLQTFLSDLEGKLRVMKALVEEDEIHQNNKPVLVQALEELNRSYHSFAKEIYPLRSKSRLSPPRHSSSSSNVGENLHPGKRTSAVGPDIEASEDGPGSVIDDLMSTEECNVECLADEVISDMPLLDKDCAMKLNFSKLVEENLHQKEELLSRNEEKRCTINMLRLQLECLKGENRALQECLGHRTAGFKRSRSQRIKGLFWDKFFKRGCSLSAAK